MPTVTERGHDAETYEDHVYTLTPEETEAIVLAGIEDARDGYARHKVATMLEYAKVAGQPNPLTPMVTSLSPDTVAVGAAGFVLTVNGSRFFESSVVQWDGAGLPTTYVSSTQLTAQVPTQSAAAIVPVTVETSGLVSAPISFEVTAAALREGEPNDSWLKADIVAWLVANGIDEEATTGLTKAELLELVY